MIVGGYGGTTSSRLKSAEVFNPSTGITCSVGNMPVVRSSASLCNRMVCGGYPSSGYILNRKYLILLLLISIDLILEDYISRFNKNVEIIDIQIHILDTIPANGLKVTEHSRHYKCLWRCQDEDKSAGVFLRGKSFYLEVMVPEPKRRKSLQMDPPPLQTSAWDMIQGNAVFICY